MIRGTFSRAKIMNTSENGTCEILFKANQEACGDAPQK